MKKEELVRKLMVAYSEKGITKNYYDLAGEKLSHLKYLAKIHLK